MSVRATEATVLLSIDDDKHKPNSRLLDIAANVALYTPYEKHELLSERAVDGRPWYQYFPGEHYHLLSCIATYIKPKVIWEFGTGSGMGCISLREGAPLAHIYSVDCDQSSGTLIRNTDGIIRVYENISSADFIANYNRPISVADLVFIDGPKDGHTEQALLRNLEAVKFLYQPLFIFDDIRVMNMVYIWRELAKPKMDLTSFGHFTGTGIVDWNGVAN